MPVLTDSIHIKKDFANLCCEKRCERSANLAASLPSSPLPSPIGGNLRPIGEPGAVVPIPGHIAGILPGGRWTRMAFTK